MAVKALDESDVGISCYISNLPGFRGILKQRYSDFIVNEVDREGNVVQLSSFDVPEESVEEKREQTTEATNISYASLIESFKSLAGDADVERLEEFLNELSSSCGDSVSPIVLSPDSDKSHRTAMHNFFRENFKFLVTDTIDGPDASSKCIRVRVDSDGPRNKGRNSRKRKDRDYKPFDSRGSENWPANVGKFLRFHLYKENKDTQEALGVIGKMLGTQPKSFGFAGTKDKRAVSTQRITVFKQRASRLASLNDRLIGIKVGDFCYVKEGLLLGQLFGNRFTITLRGIIADSEDTIKASADALGKHGFINYFGLQRFGSGSVPTHLIGAALLRGEWKLAVDMILDPRDGERNAITKAREYYKNSNDVEGTLKQLPRHMVAERAVLQSLKKAPGNYLQALKAIPRTLRMMYVHSYQSYLWNHAATTRVQKYGTEQVVVGDLVYRKDNAAGNGTGFVSRDCSVSCNNGENSSNEDEEMDVHEERNSHVKVMTAEDLEAGCYTIDDVILPMPGSRVVYPTNDVAQVYHDWAKKDAISLTECVHNVKEFSITNMTGSYRRVFQKPINFEWELLTYTDRSKPLAETDLDKMGKTRPIDDFKQVNAPRWEKEENLDCIRQPESSGDDAKLEIANDETPGDEVELLQDESICTSNSQDSQIALKLSFTLPSSCYATMAIRELLKTSTSVAYHKTLNQ
ncbi:multisubstrate pseudouridine synthase 7 [Neltuma alba]|uniref:multisubstrate pseudouridine synthase 7 n=1 Tax=Neltuma alba TaxID=207710 RepID=UPI0010A55F59|nr:multisubstrate pseudouridine synthase 7 [Prosopis alba]